MSLDSAAICHPPRAMREPRGLPKRKFAFRSWASAAPTRESETATTMASARFFIGPLSVEILSVARRKRASGSRALRRAGKDILHRIRFPDEEALGEVDSRIPNQLQDLRARDELGDGPLLERPRHFDHRPDQVLVDLVARKIPDEASVDLQI